MGSRPAQREGKGNHIYFEKRYYKIPFCRPPKHILQPASPPCACRLKMIVLRKQDYHVVMMAELKKWMKTWCVFLQKDFLFDFFCRLILIIRIAGCKSFFINFIRGLEIYFGVHKQEKRYHWFPFFFFFI